MTPNEKALEAAFRANHHPSGELVERLQAFGKIYGADGSMLPDPDAKERTRQAVAVIQAASALAARSAMLTKQADEIERLRAALTDLEAAASPFIPLCEPDSRLERICKLARALSQEANNGQ
jgi:hypothetical protein